MNQHDKLQRFLFDGAPVRGALVRLDGAWQQVLSRRAYPQALKTILGEMMAASVLMAANLKFDGTLILQIHGTGALKLAVVECNNDRTVRATAKWEGELEGKPLAELLGSGGRFVLTLEPRLDKNQTWQGIVALEGESVGEMLENYMRRSEQLDTALVLASGDDAAAGMLLQRLPEGHGEAEGWQRIQMLGRTLKSEELLTLDAEDILHRLFHEEEVRVFEQESVSFNCNCSRERVGGMLTMLGGEEVGSVLLEQGSVEIVCDYCNQHYVFDEEDVTQLFDYDVVASARDARH
ncbi:Hsp33 family molecular chaperone HslO [Chromobacterium subtsugae]|uniref:33 kDa chaperonin n=1 Tax=Chromobacterium subtsugae TaxID=251747 RepID=A0ABS7FHX3_9NEIS|nr:MULTISPECIES: Hsp33 family molecular chaperone HslO [Chromobacterium]KUM02720.1 molecular chaperone Hsp33 [Chromobacterium subtsugae]KZE84939.1 molecular chaperone Hsp33 [Chromobacterium sp. F49]MBW7567848.1 Hsp33 family molecular chaperone HslO [Chromobacterium subtsugae]MBW8289075.1 Hsp33 family molecular chaperone HslO [Chromobacterium subtsugae]WSE93781.1 Hsp33 family molecular chaperone HslO [Chromobacterium subtsugae]